MLKRSRTCVSFGTTTTLRSHGYHVAGVCLAIASSASNIDPPRGRSITISAGLRGSLRTWLSTANGVFDFMNCPSIAASTFCTLVSPAGGIGVLAR